MHLYKVNKNLELNFDNNNRVLYAITKKVLTVFRLIKR